MHPTNNHRRILLLLTVVISVVVVSVTGSSSKNGSSEPSSLADIPIKAILKDIKDITNARNSTASKFDLKRTIVGVKKHKNYEIVLYEYSDEEDVGIDLKNKEDDFDTDSQNGKSKSENNEDADEHDSGKSSSTTTTSSNPLLEFSQTTTNEPVFHQSLGKNVDRPEKSTDDNLAKSNVNINTSTKKQHSKFTPTKRRLITIPNSSSLSSRGDDDHDGESEPHLETDTPFVWGLKEGLRSGRRRHKIILLKGRNLPSTSSASALSSSSSQNDDSNNEDKNNDSTSDQPITSTEEDEEHENEEEDDNQSIYSLRKGKSNGPTTISSTTTSTKPSSSIYASPSPTPTTTRWPKVNHRKSFEDAPGAGRFIPRRKQPSPYSSPLPVNLSRSLPDTDDEDGHQQGGDKAEDEDKAGDEYDVDENEGVTFCKDPTGRPGICSEYFKCSVLYTTTENSGKINLQDYKCNLRNGEIGICCPLFEEGSRDGLGRSSTSGGGQRGRSLMKLNDRSKKPLSKQLRRLVRTNVNNSIEFGTDSLAQLEEIEADLFLRGGEVASGSAAFSHNRFFPSSKKIRQVSEYGFELLQTTNDLSERLQLTDEIGGVGLKNFKSTNTRAINDRCPRLPPCGINKYRQIDGSCNNLNRQKMGQSLTPLSRVLEPAYADGRWEPRISLRGFLLPSARLLSQTFIKDRDNPNSKYSLMTMQFGQFMDHDLSAVPVFTFANGTGISCCRNGRFLPPPDRHPNCLPIEIPSEDPFYSQFGQRCMNFVRSRIAPRMDCSLGYADQMNAVTHWLDLSNVYGSSETELRDLRLFDGGLLQFSELADRRSLLPLKRKNNGEIDYKAGDDRVNEMQGLMVMHLVWLREHNRVALELQGINPFWSDEQLFQEARRIVIAEYEHIIYNEWLPIIVGREYMESYGILPLSRRTFFKSYDPEIDSSIEAGFSAAGFRMGHTLVQGLVRLINEFGESNEAVTISNHADNAQRTRAPNQIDKWIRGLSQQPIQSFDPFVTQHLNGRLFQARGGMYGMDLSSLNIQRARDHGVPGYNAFRELCQTGTRAKSFEEFKDWISSDLVDEMRRVYDHPDDVDLWIGGISEAPLKGALIGPTFTCIVGDQFARTKKGDRYFYDIGDQTHSFSPDQLYEIRKASMARIMCDNGDELEAVQPSIFLQSDFDFNALVDCKRSRRIPRVNLQLWANEPTP